MVKVMDIVTGEIGYKPVTDTHINHFDPVGLVVLRDVTDSPLTSLQATAIMSED